MPFTARPGTHDSYPGNVPPGYVPEAETGPIRWHQNVAEAFGEREGSRVEWSQDAVEAFGETADSKVQWSQDAAEAWGETRDSRVMVAQNAVEVWGRRRPNPHRLWIDLPSKTVPKKIEV